MKKIYLALLCIPLLLFLGFNISKAVVGGSAQQQVPGPGWGMESENVDMVEVGKLLERLGKEIQQKGEITAGGKTYDVKGKGGIEWGVRNMRGGTSLQIEIYAFDRGPSPKAKAIMAYDVGGMSNSPGDAAAMLAKVAKTLAEKGAIVLDDHKVAIEGGMGIKQRLTENVRGGTRGRGVPYTYYFDVIIGASKFPATEDDADEAEEIQRGWVQELATKEIDGIDKQAIVKLFEELSADLKAGKVSIGDTSVPAGDLIQFGISHLKATEGNVHRIRYAMQFGPMTPRKRAAGPRYNNEFFDEPMKKVGALLKRMGTEILETGAFKLGENEFKVKKLADYEISASANGFSIELGYVAEKDK